MAMLVGQQLVRGRELRDAVRMLVVLREDLPDGAGDLVSELVEEFNHVMRGIRGGDITGDAVDEAFDEIDALVQEVMAY